MVSCFLGEVVQFKVMDYLINESLMRFVFMAITTILPLTLYFAYKQVTEWECSVLSYEFWNIGKILATIFVLTYLVFISFSPVIPFFDCPNIFAYAYDRRGKGGLFVAFNLFPVCAVLLVLFPHIFREHLGFRGLVEYRPSTKVISVTGHLTYLSLTVIFALYSRFAAHLLD